MFTSTAEFIIDLAEKHPTFDAFKKALVGNGAEFSDSFMTNLLRIIQHMKPPSSSTDTNNVEISNKNPLANKFPGLAIPNEKPPVFSDDESDEEKDDKKDKRITNKDIFKNESKSKSNDVVVDQAMAELEALAPMGSGSSSDIKKEEKKDVKKRERSRSRDHKDSRTKKRERSRDNKIESSRDRKSRRSSRDHRRSRSRDHISRSHDRRSRSRDRDRKRRSRSRHRSKSRDRSRRSRSRKRSRSRRRSHSREREEKDRYGDCGKKARKRTPEVELSDDPEPGKVSITFKINYFR